MTPNNNATRNHQNKGLPLDELKEFVKLHAVGQGIHRSVVNDILDRINFSSGNDSGAWAFEWMRNAENSFHDGDKLGTFVRYNLARFPFVDSEPRKKALTKCVEIFEDFCQSQELDIQRLKIAVNGLSVPVYGSNLNETGGRPLLVVMGGIVTIKEQWYGFLTGAWKIRCPVVAIDFPGGGQSPLKYHKDSAEDLRLILDGIFKHVKVDKCIAISLSFCGPLFMKLSLSDHRIKGIIASASPIYHFFTDAEWWRKVPMITRSSMAHCMGISLEQLAEKKKEMGLPPDELEKIDIPVTYIASLHDEIIPPDEWDLVREKVSNARVIKINDVHGAPNRLRQYNLELIWSILRHTNREMTPIGLLVGTIRFLMSIAARFY